MRRVFAWLNESIFKTAFHHLCGSRLLLRALGFKMPPLRTSIGFGGAYGDLATFLLGLVMLGFNGIPLPLKRVRDVMAKPPDMMVREVVTYAWNPHVLFIAEHRPAPQSASTPTNAGVAGVPAGTPSAVSPQ